MSEKPSNPYTRGIAEFVSRLKCAAIPGEVRARARLLMLDAFGCALYGAHLEWCRILQTTLAKLDRSAACGVWGTSRRLSAPHAALVNGTQVQGFELDDVHRQGVLHVGAVVLPALVAIAELRRGMTGREFLASAVAGYEVGARVGLCMGQEHIGQGWHSGATLGVFSAGAAAARGLKLGAGKTVHALGIAGTQASGLMAAQYGAMVKRMHAGRAAQSGLYGALLAEAGFTGIPDVLEGLEGVVGEVAVEQVIHRVRVEDEKQRCPVPGRPGRFRLADRAARAAPVLDDDRAAEAFGEFRREHARDAVDRAARGPGDDKAQRLARLAGGGV